MVKPVLRADNTAILPYSCVEKIDDCFTENKTSGLYQQDALVYVLPGILRLYVALRDLMEFTNHLFTPHIDVRDASEDHSISVKGGGGHSRCYFGHARVSQ